jgi:hypothetical protein
MPLIPEPPIPTKWMWWIFGRRVRPAQPPRRLFHGPDPRRLVHEAGELPGEGLAGEILLLDHPRRPRGGECLRVGALVVVGGLREGHQDRGSSPNRELGAGRGPTAGEHEVRARHPDFHVVEEGHHLVAPPRGLVGARHLVLHPRAGLVHDSQAVLPGQMG